MSCWTRHLGDVIAAAGVENTSANKKKIDKFVREKYAIKPEVHCPEVWKEYVQPILADEQKKNELTMEIRKLFS